MEIVSIVGRHLLLRPFLNEDLSIVFGWRSKVSDLFLWYQRPEILSFDEFCADFAGFRRNIIHVLMMITLGPNQNAIGMVYSYKADYINGHAFLCTYLDENYRQSLYGGEATLLFLEYLFGYFSFRKVYAEIYDYNSVSLSNSIKGGFVEEGRYKSHKWYKNAYRDMIILALYREAFFSKYDGMLSALKNGSS